MADTEQTAAPTEEAGEEGTDCLAYKKPAPKSLKEIQEMDKDDESLTKYKKSLLGEVAEPVAPGEGPKVKLLQLALLAEGHDPIVFDLTGDLAKLKETTCTIKEGTVCTAKLTFVVENDIVSGLKYIQTSYRARVEYDTSSYMLGSYPPKTEHQVFQTRLDEFPKGLLARGHYTVRSKFTDDDDRNFLTWEWAFDLKKDWE